MKEIHITEKEEGQRLDKILGKYLDQAPASFLYKMLRKKNIKLNGKKADGKEKVKAGDQITLYLSDETIEKFQKPGAVSNQTAGPSKKAEKPSIGFPEILFENEDILLMNKPAGILSQKAGKDDISINEQMIAYCLEKGLVTEEELKIRKPSVANRLDRNTTGLIAAGISIRGLTFLAELFRNRDLEKYYVTIVKGKMTKKETVKGYLTKNKKTNQVTVRSRKESEEDSYIETCYEPLRTTEKYTLLKVKLVTGKPHQIRAHLAFLGHPILGDEKYGDHRENRYWKKEAGLSWQLLHSETLIFPKLTGHWESISKKQFQAPKPEQFLRIEKKIFG
jgi:23S rRNA pseudouridine955/2504/2580 synthase